MNGPRAGFERACRVDEIPVGEGRTAVVAGRAVAIFRTEHGFRCTAAACSHRAGPLADGLLADASITCPLHQRRFDLATGAAIGHDCPAITVHPVEVRGDDIYVAVGIPERAGGAVGPNTRAA
jgi:nitrite reductase (NADH) small subunit